MTKKAKEAEESYQEEVLDALAERAAEVFKTHSVDTCYFTSDGTCFVEMQHAKMHAQSLGDGQVLPYKRKEQ